MTRRRPCKKQESHPYPNLSRKEQHKQNIHRQSNKKEKKKPKRKQTIIQVDDLLVQKLINLVTLGKYFPLEVFNKGMITSTHMVSYHETLVEDRTSENEESVLGVELSKTKEDVKVIANL